MVSLRNSLPALRRGALVTGRIALLVGVGLLLLNALGLAVHSRSTNHSSQNGSLREYVASLRTGAAFDLGEATRRIYLGTTHSDARRIAVTENWLQWALGRIYPPLSRTQDTDRLIAGNLANCSERSQILKDLAECAGCDCRFAGLSGHVVLEVKLPRGWHVADPDYGVVYPLGIAELQQAKNQRLVGQTLYSAGYSRPVIERYIQILQSTEDNVVLPVRSPLSPRLDLAERACHWLVWLIPWGCILFSAAAQMAFLRSAFADRLKLSGSNRKSVSGLGVATAACSPSQAAS